MEESKTAKFYVTDPTEEKDSFGKFVQYQLKGDNIPNPLPRRYREFDLLRAKLLERWPGLLIPPLPRKKAIGNKTQDTVDTRMNQLNRFCKLVGKDELFYNSPETQAFLQNTSSVEKAINGCQKETQQTILGRYKERWQMPTDFDKKTVEREQEGFINSMKNTLVKLNEIKEAVKELKAKEEKIPELFKSTVEMFNTYEEQGMEEFADGDRTKYIFYKIAPKKLQDSVKRFHVRYNNPYESLDVKIHDDILDIEALGEAWEKIGTLKASRDKMIKGGQAGSPDCQAMMELIDLITYVFNLQIEKFKKDFTDGYYKQLNAIRKSCAINAKHMNDLGAIVLNNRNLTDE